jgi:hypothetical protein
LISKKEDQKNGSTVYWFTSRLSREEILDFYRKSFARVGLSEWSIQAEQDDSRRVFMYRDDKQAFVTLTFSPEEEGPTKYTVISGKVVVPRTPASLPSFSEMLQSAFKELRDPEELEFMPLYPSLKQLERRTWKNPAAISLGYLSSDDAGQIKDFYLTNMPSAGWTQTSIEPHSGSYVVAQWFRMVAPYSQGCPQCDQEYTQEYRNIPALKIHGFTITFMRDGGQKCVVTVHTFEDAVALSKSTKYDLTAMEKHGNTVIGVIYYPGEQSDFGE